MTLVEVVVGIGILLVIFLALFGLLQLSTSLANVTKVKAVATEIAANKIEMLRTGTNTFVAGTQTATTTNETGIYKVETTIVDFDDPLDGLGAADSDGNQKDYVKAQVNVTYSASNEQGSVTLTTNIATSTK